MRQLKDQESHRNMLTRTMETMSHSTFGEKVMTAVRDVEPHAKSDDIEMQTVKPDQAHNKHHGHV
jgi:hypothetical protein